MKRRLVNLLAALSLLLCAAAVVMWAPSRILNRATRFWLGGEHLLMVVDLYPRDVIVCFVRGSALRECEMYFCRRTSVPTLDPWNRNWLGFGTDAYLDQGFRGWERWIAIPYWSILCTTAALPLAHLAAYVKRRRSHQTGFCVQCGYDLRATPERCPECGTAGPVSAAAADLPKG
jgi:hypothetical protein